MPLISNLNSNRLHWCKKRNSWGKVKNKSCGATAISTRKLILNETYLSTSYQALGDWIVISIQCALTTWKTSENNFQNQCQAGNYVYLSIELKFFCEKLIEFMDQGTTFIPTIQVSNNDKQICPNWTIAFWMELKKRTNKHYFF